MERFPHRAQEVVLADSRVRDLSLEPYHKFGRGEAVPCPDLKGPKSIAG